MKKTKKANLEEESQIKGGVKSEPYYLFDEKTGLCKKCDIPYCKHWFEEVLQ